MDIDRLIRLVNFSALTMCFGSLMDIDRLILLLPKVMFAMRFGSLMDIDRLILDCLLLSVLAVLVL